MGMWIMGCGRVWIRRKVVEMVVRRWILKEEGVWIDNMIWV